MTSGIKAQYDGIVAFPGTDFTGNPKRITVPTLVVRGEDGQVVPFADAGPPSATLVRGPC
jgi:non-heme chloroperoxidase